MNTKLRIATSTAIVLAVIGTVTFSVGNYASGQSGTGFGYGPQPTVELSPGPVTATPEAPTATAEPTVVVTTIPPTQAASPEPTSTPTSEELWAAMIADLLRDALAQFREDMRVAVYEDATILFEAYASTHSGQLSEFSADLIAFDHKLAVMEGFLTELEAAIDEMPGQSGPSNTDIMLYLQSMRGEVRDIRDKVYEPTPTPTATAVVTPVPGGATVVEICNQCVVGQ